MDGAAVVSDLVHTMRLSDFLCGACLASLNPARVELATHPHLHTAASAFSSSPDPPSVLL